ncbi:MAG: hypothetical protein Q9171_006129 [Xanthocarpia ochracea]
MPHAPLGTILRLNRASMLGSRDYTLRGDVAGKGYINEDWFVCRARVVGVETEPLRVVEKTKRRQRRVKRVKSKMRFTVLRVVEVGVRVPGMEEEEALLEVEEEAEPEVEEAALLEVEEEAKPEVEEEVRLEVEEEAKSEVETKLEVEEEAKPEVEEETKLEIEEEWEAKPEVEVEEKAKPDVEEETKPELEEEAKPEINAAIDRRNGASHDELFPSLQIFKLPD